MEGCFPQGKSEYNRLPTATLKELKIIIYASYHRY